MTAPPQTLTMTQKIALNLVYAVMDERPYHLTYDDTAIIAKLPPLKVLLHQVNQLLSERHKSNGCKCNVARLPELCRFRAGDRYIAFEPYPKEISMRLSALRWYRRDCATSALQGIKHF